MPAIEEAMITTQIADDAIVPLLAGMSPDDLAAFFDSCVAEQSKK